MFASKYKGGISKNRIIAAFDFLKQRSEEASLAARREASLIRKQQQQAQDDADAAAAAAENENGEEGGSGGKQEKTEEELFALKKTPWEKNAESTLPQGGAGLVSLMGDMSNLEERMQGGWKLAIKAGGRSVIRNISVFVNRTEVMGRGIGCGGCSFETMRPLGKESVERELCRVYLGPLYLTSRSYTVRVVFETCASKIFSASLMTKLAASVFLARCLLLPHRPNVEDAHPFVRLTARWTFYSETAHSS